MGGVAARPLASKLRLLEASALTVTVRMRSKKVVNHGDASIADSVNKDTH